MNAPVYSIWRGELLVQRPRVYARDILKDVAERHRLSLDDLSGPCRKKKLARARHEAMWEIRERTALSLPQIGAILGGRHHTTVMHGVRCHAARMCGESAD